MGQGGGADFPLPESTDCGSAVYFIWCMLSAMCRIVCSHRLAALISSLHRGVLYKPQHQHDSQLVITSAKRRKKISKEKKAS